MRMRPLKQRHACMSNVIHVLPTVETAVSDSEAENNIQSPTIVSGYVARIIPFAHAIDIASVSLLNLFCQLLGVIFRMLQALYNSVQGRSLALKYLSML